jgi:hypothetical protein
MAANFLFSYYRVLFFWKLRELDLALFLALMIWPWQYILRWRKGQEENETRKPRHRDTRFSCYEKHLKNSALAQVPVLVK